LAIILKVLYSFPLDSTDPGLCYMLFSMSFTLSCLHFEFSILQIYYSPAGAVESIWFCWRTWRWDQFVFYIRYLKRL